MDLLHQLPAIKALWTKYKKYTKRTVVFLGLAYFIVYNFIANTPGQARELDLPGLREKVCGEHKYLKGEVDQCGKRSIFGDADWGITAYITIYGVETEKEAQEIYEFMKTARKQAKQEGIPIHLTIYTLPKSVHLEANKSSEIFDKRF
ncbi:MAG: hypothetical protein QE278_13120 [Limnobacter sp.]|nr:hypothetical protein [Limnobacter sp.]